jgi:hypothetical protein
MTKEEIQKKSEDKVKAVEILLKQLNLTTFAKQVVAEDGSIDNMVFYRDNERYQLDTPPKEEKKNDETTRL